MPSTSSEAAPAPDRWDYSPAEIGELPAELRPNPAYHPQPDAKPCTGAGAPCGAPVEPRWCPPRSVHGNTLGGGYWSPGGLCQACRTARADAAARQRLAELVIAAGIPDRYTWATWEAHVKQAKGEGWADFRDRLDATPGHLGITAWNAPTAATVRDWRPAPGMKPTPRVLYLTGPVGSGKTTLAAAAAMAILRGLAADRSDTASRYRVAWISAGDLWETLRLETSKNRERGALARWAAVDVLVLDDLGTLEGVKAWHRDTLEYLVCHRYNADRPTLITSNLRLDSEDPEEVTIAGLFGERVVSRLVEGLGGRRRGPPPGYLELLGMDWRADVPHAQPDPARPLSPSSTPASPSPSRAHAAPRQLGMDWQRRAAGDNDD